MVGDLVLQNDFFGMGAMAEQRHGCHQDGHHRYGSVTGARSDAPGVFGVFFQFGESSVMVIGSQTLLVEAGRPRPAADAAGPFRLAQAGSRDARRSLHNYHAGNELQQRTIAMNL